MLCGIRPGTGVIIQAIGVPGPLITGTITMVTITTGTRTITDIIIITMITSTPVITVITTVPGGIIPHTWQQTSTGVHTEPLTRVPIPASRVLNSADRPMPLPAGAMQAIPPGASR